MTALSNVVSEVAVIVCNDSSKTPRKLLISAQHLQLSEKSPNLNVAMKAAFYLGIILHVPKRLRDIYWPLIWGAEK